MRKTFSSGLALEDQVGYSRAVQVDSTLYTSATAPVDENMKVVGVTGYEQAVYVFDKLGKVFDEAGFAFDDVVQARLYVADADKASTAYRAFKEYLGVAAPVISVVAVVPWAKPEMLLEIELVAVKPR